MLHGLYTVTIQYIYSYLCIYIIIYIYLFIHLYLLIITYLFIHLFTYIYQSVHSCLGMFFESYPGAMPTYASEPWHQRPSPSWQTSALAERGTWMTL